MLPRRIYIVAPSSPGESSLDQLIISRIKASIQSLINIRQQLEKQDIKGDTYDTLRNLLCDIIRNIEGEIEDKIGEIELIPDEEIKILRSDRIHRVLEEFLYHKVGKTLQLLDLVRILNPNTFPKYQQEF